MAEKWMEIHMNKKYNSLCLLMEKEMSVYLFISPLVCEIEIPELKLP